MKRIISLLLVIVMCLSLIACGGGTEKAPEATAAPEATNEELTQAVDLLKKAEDSIITAASHQLDGWTKYASIMEYYFVDSKYQEANESSIAKRAKKIHELRVSAKEAMDEAKALMGTNGTSDYYAAVKEYYKTVSVFWNLISEFPEGYSKLTYSTTASDYKANCQSAYAELEFYK